MIIEVDGVRMEVPDDATPDEIDSLTRPQPGRGESLRRGAVQGATLMFGDELAGMARGARAARPEPSLVLPKKTLLDPKARSEVFATRPGEAAAEAQQAKAERREAYLQARDENRAGNVAAQQANPWTYGGGMLGGGLLTAPLLPGLSAARAPTLLGRMGQAARAGATVGGISGVGRAEEVSDIPRTAAIDAAIGGVAAPVLQAGGEAVGTGLGALRDRIAGWASQVATNQGRKVLTGNAAPMATRKPLSREAIDAAYRAGAIKPGGTVEKAAEVLGGAREAAGERYAQILAQLEAQGVTGPNASTLARDLMAASDKARSTTFTTVDPGPDSLSAVANELLGLQKGMHGVKRVAPKALTGEAPGGDLPLTVAEELKRKLQRAAQSEYVKEGPQSLGGEAKTELASRLRQAVEDAVSEQASKAPEAAAAFEPVKRELGALIEASKAADRAAARAANRQQFGLGAKVAASGVLASGNLPGAIGTLLATTALRNRGPAMLGYGANLTSRALSAPGLRGGLSPAASGVATETLAEEAAAFLRALAALRGGPRVGLPAGAAGEEESR